MSTSTFSLDSAIFNKTLYKKITDIWFPGVDTSGKEFDMSIAKRWFAGSPEERLALDGQCRDVCGKALKAIGPENFPEANAQPFLDEIARVAEEENKADGATGEDAAWTALSFALLLDQMPRNIYRTDEGLRLVYGHYDRMGDALVRNLLSPASPIGRPDKHPALRFSAAHRTWFYMPLMHSEDLSAHDLAEEIIAEFARELEGLDGYNGTKMLIENYQKAAKEHRDPVERFGRYPHRNAALGRTSTEEERRFMEDGGATFGVAQNQKGNTAKSNGT
ncbi:uncharacterized protein J4E92_006850 [Alternaria infectoria]|uniref:uncharacterized protein n=1 Tax=Alternaria infectoria TaxID=45303 RepID=UPI0022207DC2|nr:uncharacterized protein J4E92_006850 [Alternaria infectoria]KAI4926112.1 hypothetical protein J4E92_006850 [Alternaria infectoria]